MSNPFADDEEEPANSFDDNGLARPSMQRGSTESSAAIPRPSALLSSSQRSHSDAAPAGSSFDADFGGTQSNDPSMQPMLYGVDEDINESHSGSLNAAAKEALRRANPAAWFKSTSNERGTGVDDFGMSETPTNEKRRKSKIVAQWPFDNHHTVQQAYYETLLDSRDTTNQDSPQNNQYNLLTQRPLELPDIPTAVQGLELSEFEVAAQQRAIGIIATWIYDEALMEDLLWSPSSQGGAPEPEEKEGIEVNALGNPILHSQLKMDKEIFKLRESTSRELAMINARLNDGVAASGTEVQELVHNINKTKGELGKLRELTTYLAQPGQNGEFEKMALLKNYPKIRGAIFAQKNLNKCFHELDLFAQIPATCQRLREEMHNSEWQEHEWRTLRSVCREHVELEVFLVEAESGMKARIDEEVVEARKQNLRQPRSRGQEYDLVDAFLEEHAATVKELGDEIKLRVLSGVGTTFDLALNNPAGMVALVEAIEVYELKANQFKQAHGDVRQRLYFTDMRREALEKICEDFEDRGLEIFKEVQELAADEAGEDAATAAYNAVLRASNTLTNEMDFVQHQMAPCFPHAWHVEALWASVVARVSSQNLFQQIGGRDGHNLHALTVTQLLDLVAWVESFVEKIHTTFPDIEIKPTNSIQKSAYDSGASLLHGNKKEIDVVRAKDSVAWVSSVLLEVKQLAQTEFIARTQGQTEEWLVNVYNAEHAKTQTEEGKLTTSLCEDVYSLAGVQLRTIRERLTKKSDVLVLAVNIIFNSLALQQRMHRDLFLTDLETCCAAANDFLRMSDSCEDILSELREATNFSEQSIDDLYEQSNVLLQLYSTDAVFAAQRSYMYVFEPIEEEVGEALFDDIWEKSLTHNELALTVVRTLEDYMTDLETWLEDLMVRKVVDALVIATLNFYIRRLLLKAEKKSSRASSFDDPLLAYQRITGDLKIFRNYFEGLVRTFPALQRVIDQEFQVMDLVMTMLSAAAGISDTEPTELVWEFQKIIKDVQLTKCTVGNLFHLMNPKEEYRIYEICDDEDTATTLKHLAPDGQAMVDDRTTDRGLRLDLVVKDTLGNSRRARTAGLGGRAQNLANKVFTKKSEDEEDDDNASF